MIYKFSAKLEGGHWHVGVWTGKTDASLGKCGDLVFREGSDWEEFKRCLMVPATPHASIIIEELGPGGGARKGAYGAPLATGGAPIGYRRGGASDG